MDELIKLEEMLNMTGLENSRNAPNDLANLDNQTLQQNASRFDGKQPLVQCNEGKRLSGAQKRKIKKERLRNQNGDGSPHQQTSKTKTSDKEVKNPMEFYNTKSLDDILAVALVPTGFPSVRLSKCQIDQIRTSLMLAIDEAVAKGCQLHFDDCIKFRGALVLKCKNQFSFDWLKMTISNWTFQDFHLSIIHPKDLPIYTKLIMWVQGSEDPKKIFEKLATQNRGLETKGWHLINTKFERNGQTLVVSVDEKSMEVLKEADFRPFLSLGRVKLTALKKSKIGSTNDGKLSKCEKGENCPNEEDE